MNIKMKHILKYKHFLVLLLFIPLQGLFFYCEKVVIPKYIMHSRIDDYIPFVKEFIIPYYLWYVYMIAAFVYLGFASKKDFYRLFAFIFGGMTISCIIYLLFPNGQDLRPRITEMDAFSTMIRNIYSVDTPTNVAPSMHVLNSIAVHIALIKCPKLSGKLFISIPSFIAMVTISASTVFVKQHSILDVIWGAVLSMALFLVIYELPRLIAYRRMTAEEGIKS
jgi:membrane-associated phospholipid phosphatase